MATVREIAGYLEERVPSSLKLDFAGFPDSEEKTTILNFIRSSKRGIVRANTSGEKGDID